MDVGLVVIADRTSTLAAIRDGVADGAWFVAAPDVGALLDARIPSRFILVLHVNQCEGSGVPEKGIRALVDGVNESESTPVLNSIRWMLDNWASAGGLVIVSGGGVPTDQDQEDIEDAMGYIPADLRRALGFVDADTLNSSIRDMLNERNLPWTVSEDCLAEWQEVVDELCGTGKKAVLFGALAGLLPFGWMWESPACDSLASAADRVAPTGNGTRSSQLDDAEWEEAVAVNFANYVRHKRLIDWAGRHAAKAKQLNAEIAKRLSASGICSVEELFWFLSDSDDWSAWNKKLTTVADALLDHASARGTA